MNSSTSGWLVLTRNFVAGSHPQNDIAEQTAAVLRLLRKYADLRMDLADARIVRMAELVRDCRVVTVDRTDFSAYRRNGRDLIPLVAPPVEP